MLLFIIFYSVNNNEGDLKSPSDGNSAAKLVIFLDITKKNIKKSKKNI